MRKFEAVVVWSCGQDASSEVGESGCRECVKFLHYDANFILRKNAADGTGENGTSRRFCMPVVPATRRRRFRIPVYDTRATFACPKFVIRFA